jgi:hypothetical protein
MQVFFLLFIFFLHKEPEILDLFSFFASISRMFDSLKKNAEIYLSLEETDQVMTWCDDCGNYGIQKALFQALTRE